MNQHKQLQETKAFEQLAHTLLKIQFDAYRTALLEIDKHFCHCVGNFCPICVARKALGVPLRNPNIDTALERGMK